MKRVVVTGASGFVGANLTRRLLQDGHEVHILLRKPEENWRLREIARDCRITYGDVSDREAVRSWICSVKPQSAFHLAAYGAYSYQKGLEQMIATNVIGCAALLDACIEANVESFVQTGSSSEYGYKDHAAGEGELLEPNSHYAITKAAATHYCSYTAKTSKIRAITARLYSVYGPWEEPTRLVPTLLVHCLRGDFPPLVSPATARDFVYVDDAVSALLAIVEARELPVGGAYNVSSGIQTSLAALVDEVRSLLKVAAEPQWNVMPRRSWDTDVWVGDPAAIKRDAGWQADVGLREGLLRMIDWFMQNPEWLSVYQSRIFPG